MKLSEDSEDLCRTLTQRLRREITSCSPIMLPCYIAGLSSSHSHLSAHIELIIAVRMKFLISFERWSLSPHSISSQHARHVCSWEKSKKKKIEEVRTVHFSFEYDSYDVVGMKRKKFSEKKIIKIINSTTTKKWKKLLFYFFHVKWPIITHQHKSPFLCYILSSFSPRGLQLGPTKQ